jgi:hypothetical protein
VEDDDVRRLSLTLGKPLESAPSIFFGWSLWGDEFAVP